MALPYRPVDAQARALARALLADVRHAVLGTLDPDTGGPYLSRIAVQSGDDGVPVALLSSLAAHTRALCRDPRAALLVDPVEPVASAPLTRPRLSLQVTALPLRQQTAARRAAWRARDPKSAVYVDLPDFEFWQLTPVSGLLNAGFGQACRLAPSDLLPDSGRPAMP